MHKKIPKFRIKNNYNLVHNKYNNKIQNKRNKSLILLN